MLLCCCSQSLHVRRMSEANAAAWITPLAGHSAALCKGPLRLLLLHAWLSAIAVAVRLTEWCVGAGTRGSILTLGTPTELHSTGQRSLHVGDHALQPRDAEGKEHLVVPDVAPALYAGRDHLRDVDPGARRLPRVEPVHSIGYIERTIALATHAVQHAVESPTPWFPVVATLCTGNGSLPGGCNAAELPVATDLSDLSFGQLVMGNTTGAARPTVMALWNADDGAGKLSTWREQTQNDWVGDRMVPLPCQAPRVDDYVTADEALANVRKHTAYSNFISVDLRFPLDPCVSEPVFTCKCAFVHHPRSDACSHRPSSDSHVWLRNPRSRDGK